MSELLHQIQVWVESLIRALGYPGIVIVMAIENIFPPIPSEVVLPLAGFMVGQGELNFIGVVLAGTLGSVIGALVLYGLGAWAHEPVIRRFVRHYGRWFLISEADLDRTLATFARRGDLVIFTGRLIPLIRSLISIPAGMHRMPLGRFLVYTTLGTALWSAILAGAGVLLGRNWELVIEYVERYQRVVLVLIVLAVLAFLYIRLVKPRLQPLRRQPAERDEGV